MAQMFPASCVLPGKTKQNKIKQKIAGSFGVLVNWRNSIKKIQHLKNYDPKQARSRTHFARFPPLHKKAALPNFVFSAPLLCPFRN